MKRWKTIIKDLPRELVFGLRSECELPEYEAGVLPT